MVQVGLVTMQEGLVMVQVGRVMAQVGWVMVAQRLAIEGKSVVVLCGVELREEGGWGEGVVWQEEEGAEAGPAWTGAYEGEATVAPQVALLPLTLIHSMVGGEG